MKIRNNRARLIFIILVIVWSVFEFCPPASRDLAAVFQAKAVRRDDVFNGILARFRDLQRQRPQSEFINLVEAIGTNDVTRYFPYDVKGEPDATRSVLNALQRDAAGKIRLGLDLQGGTSFLVGVDLSNIPEDGKPRALSQAAEVLRKRVDRFGVAEPVIQPQGKDRILVQLPGLSEADKDQARGQIQKAAFLEFKLVAPDSDAMVLRGEGFPGYEFKAKPHKAADGRDVAGYLVKRKAELVGSVKKASVIRGSMGEPKIAFTFNDKGAEVFGRLTKENVGNQLAIVLDGELQTAPNIREPILTGNGEISGNYTEQEAFQLANVLENPLETPVKVLSESSVDPTLGKDTIHSGIWSAIYGTIAVAGFMAAYYFLAGCVADVALMTNIVILLGVMCSIGTTLTLPGIAGVVLTVGMAVDANVLIFERIREELGKAKSLRGALEAGYNRAFGTIFDSHVTTLISSIILIYMGTGPIKGFGVTLTIGVAASLFTALVVTRLIFDFMLARGWLKGLPMLHIIRSSRLNFMALAKPLFACSWLIIVIGLAYGLFVRGHKMEGIDFAGGDNLALRFSQKVEPEEVRAAIRKLGVLEPQIQYQKDVMRNAEALRITSPSGTGNMIATGLASAFPAAHFELAAMENVGPTIGSEILRTAIIASLLSMAGILVYVAFRYEFSFAVAAIVAVFHDVLMTLAIYCLTGVFSEGRQFNATVVAALLTIIGFSLNDKVVIFDRIREDLKLGSPGTFRDIINQALNQTLSRTIITSGTVFLATMSLFLFGGGAINDFAFTFLVGIITGTYSSIYIASALVLWWHRGAKPSTAPARVNAGYQEARPGGMRAPGTA